MKSKLCIREGAEGFKGLSPNVLASFMYFYKFSSTCVILMKIALMYCWARNLSYCKISINVNRQREKRLIVMHDVVTLKCHHIMHYYTKPFFSCLFLGLFLGAALDFDILTIQFLQLNDFL